MTKRSVAAVIIFSIITFGIYWLYWLVKTKNEMNRLGADIPTALLIIVPFAGIYWMWKFAGGVQHVTGGKQSQGTVFILMWLLNLIGVAIVQSELNTSVDRQLPVARVA